MFPDEFDALVIDTSIFIGNGLRLEKSLLGKLSQFRRSPIDLIIPDVIESELRRHLESKTKESKLKLEKALNDAGDHLAIDETDAAKIHPASKDIAALVDERIKGFIESTGAINFECGKFVSVTEVLTRYFSNHPPFAETGSKKAEFPDAIVLMALNNWAMSEKKNVLLVSGDSDWEKYCEDSDNLFFIGDLSNALALFNKSNAAYVFIEILERELQAGNAKPFISSIEKILERDLYGMTPDQGADSYLYWEPDGCNAWFKAFTLTHNRFTVIDQDADWVILSAQALITVEAEGDFSLSVHDSIDNDHVSMGGVTVTTTEEFESEILIHISGDLTGPIDEIKIDDVEVVDPISQINFGTLEPDFGDDIFED